MSALPSRSSEPEGKGPGAKRDESFPSHRSGVQPWTRPCLLTLGQG